MRYLGESRLPRSEQFSVPAGEPCGFLSRGRALRTHLPWLELFGGTPRTPHWREAENASAACGNREKKNQKQQPQTKQGEKHNSHLTGTAVTEAEAAPIPGGPFPERPLEGAAAPRRGRCRRGRRCLSAARPVLPPPPPPLPPAASRLPPPLWPPRLHVRARKAAGGSGRNK